MVAPFCTPCCTLNRRRLIQVGTNADRRHSGRPLRRRARMAVGHPSEVSVVRTTSPTTRPLPAAKSDVMGCRGSRCSWKATGVAGSSCSKHPAASPIFETISGRDVRAWAPRRSCAQVGDARSDAPPGAVRREAPFQHSSGRRRAVDVSRCNSQRSREGPSSAARSQAARLCQPGGVG
jgi:hypothetical protein